MEKIDNHIDLSIKRLLKQFQNKPKFKALIESNISGFQDIENVIWELYNLKYRDSTGFTLDKYGEILGIERQGLSDEQYIQVIDATICENISEGLIEDLIQIFRLLTNPKKVFLFEPDPFVICIAAQNPSPLSKPAHVLKALKSAKLAGTRLNAFYILDSPFMFAENELIKPRGFGIEENPETGGRFAFELE
ncbi:hypothetical protein [Fluviispira vulneris]|uniref:hypothetical protein n=1 Tax=Fluviispira vulneris TaxID=2763012 RepID=UPI001644E753|nr:hypothetical protein [Fluviispira vulneris]